jgi:formylglycine-generating enzyme required for sulfatase activity
MPCPQRSWLAAVLVVSAALAASLLALESRAEDPPKGKKYALLVGVKDYGHARLSKLRFTENDVEALAELLNKKVAGFDSVQVLTDSRGKKNPADKPSAANIRGALKKLLAKKERLDTVLVALSGHGIQLQVKGEDGKKKDEGFFCPSDAQLNDSESMIMMSQLFKDLDRCGAGVRLLLVDACRNEVLGEKSLDTDYLPKPAVGTIALFSCSSGQKSHETPDLDKGHGIFFYHVLQGLRGEAKNKKNTVTWQDLAAYVQREVPPAVTKIIREGAQQSPEQVGRITNAPVLADYGGAGIELEPAKEIENSIGIKLKLVPAGRFIMGSPATEKQREPEEFQHAVRITRHFYLGVYEVTQEQYKKVTGENPSAFSPGGDQARKVRGRSTASFPVENVSWTDAKEFCDKLTRLAAERRQKRVYRLPTEAEWEYACRGGARDHTPFHFGKLLSTDWANFDPTFIPYRSREKGPFLDRPCDVGKFEKPNDFGLHDMHGNVQEWCGDYYHKGYYKDSPAADPKGPNEGKYRVVRGGAWNTFALACRTAKRVGMEDKPHPHVGFRVVCEVPAGAR